MVKMKPRRKKASVKVEKSCRVGRTYRDFLNFIEENPDTPIIQMDTMIGKVGDYEPVLLTIHFVKEELMLAFKRNSNTAKSVTEIINDLYSLLGHDNFTELLPLFLGDNGSEFSNPSSIEKAPDGSVRTRVFYTDPGAPYQKGACENNHSLIRRLIPKGTSFKDYSQNDINLMMNHVNSYTRKKLKNLCPISAFNFFHGSAIPKLLGIEQIPPNEVILNPTLFKK
jgi:IS30 family transposase